MEPRTKRVYAGRAAKWDPRRNTSAVRAVPAGALDELLGVLRAARERGDEWYRWIADGRPPLSEAEYAATRRARGRS